MLSIWPAVIFLGIGWVFGQTAWVGWKTGVTRLPLSLFTIEEFERGQSVHFWPVTAINVVVAGAALAAAGFEAWSAFGVPSRPLETITMLNGCYEGEGMPDKMRPRDQPRAFRIADGVLFNSEGSAISHVRIIRNTTSTTIIGFYPSLSFTTSTDGLKRLVVSVGSTAAAEAYARAGKTYIAVPDRLFPVRTTPCR